MSGYKELFGFERLGSVAPTTDATVLHYQLQAALAEIENLKREREELKAELKAIIESAGLNPDNTEHARDLLAKLEGE